MQIIRAGREAAELICPHTHQRFVQAIFSYTDRKGDRRQKGFGKFGHTYQLS